VECDDQGPMKAPSHVLIDGDVICYAVGFAAQSKEFTVDGTQFDDKGLAEAYAEKRNMPMEPVIIAEPVEYALSSVKRMIKHIVEGAEAETYDIILSGPNNFRDDVATIQPYKGNRSGAPKPVHHPAIFEYLTDVQNAIVVDGEEADDYLSYTSLATGATIATIDKDLLNTEGWHYNWNKKVLINQTVRDARLHFYTQMLTGDSTDHIPGLYKLTGQKATAKIKKGLLECETEEALWVYVWAVWATALNKKDDSVSDRENVKTALGWLKEIGILLHMRRTEKELWTPPTSR
jgi:hypothetical protein